MSRARVDVGMALAVLFAASAVRKGKSTAVDYTHTTTTSGYRDPEAKPIRKFTDARKAAKAKAKRRKYK